MKNKFKYYLDHIIYLLTKDKQFLKATIISFIIYCILCICLVMFDVVFAQETPGTSTINNPPVDEVYDSIPNKEYYIFNTTDDRLNTTSMLQEHFNNDIGVYLGYRGQLSNAQFQYLKDNYDTLKTSTSLVVYVPTDYSIDNYPVDIRDCLSVGSNLSIVQGQYGEAYKGEFIYIRKDGSTFKVNNDIWTIQNPKIYNYMRSRAASIEITPFPKVGCGVYDSSNNIYDVGATCEVKINNDLNNATISNPYIAFIGDSIDIKVIPNQGYIFENFIDIKNNDNHIHIDNIYKLNYKYTGVVKLNETPPQIELPQPQVNNNINIDNSINVNINNSISSYMKGGYIQLVRTDYYDLYTCHKTLLAPPGFLSSQKLEYYQYVTNANSNAPNSADFILMPVYSHTEIKVYGPNMTVSNNSLGVITGQYETTNGYKFDVYAYADGKGILQRDVNTFDITYVDEHLKKCYGYENLPITNSALNQTKLELQGHKGVSYSVTQDSYNLDYNFKIGQEDFHYYFYVTDTQSHVNVVNNYINQNKLTQSQIEASQQNTNILNNAINGFKNMFDNLFQHGNASSQQAQQQLNDKNNVLNQTNNKFEQLENKYSQDLQNNLNQIKPDDHNLSAHQGFLNATKFVKIQFDELTRNNPIGQVLGFSLMIGLALLLLSKRL